MRYVVDGLVPDYGTLGVCVGYNKTGKTTFALALAASVATGQPFLERTTTTCRVLIVAAEDPPEYTAYLSRHLNVPPKTCTIYRRPMVLDPPTLKRLTHTIRAGGYGLVLLWSWQHLVRGLIRDENDNAGAVQVAEVVKNYARTSGVPWLIDAHSGKGEDQSDNADPTKAMRGASAVGGAADYVLSLRYASSGTFGTQRRLAGRGRFVNVEPTTIDYDPETGGHAVGATGTKTETAATTWRLIQETGALTTEGRSAGVIAKAAGLVPNGGEVTNTHRRHVCDAFSGRANIRMVKTKRSTLYSFAEGTS